MEWWQYVMLYGGIWLMGFFTGRASGIGSLLMQQAEKASEMMKQGAPQFDLDMFRSASNSLMKER
jgi:hypothetical protein